VNKTLQLTLQFPEEVAEVRPKFSITHTPHRQQKKQKKQQNT